MTISERLTFAVNEALRVDPALSKAALARKLQIGRQVLYNWCNGAVESPSSTTVHQLARIARLSPEWVLAGTGPKRPVNKLTEAESSLVDVFRILSPDNQTAILKQMAFMRSTQFVGDPSRRDAFHRKLNQINESAEKYELPDD